MANKGKFLVITFLESGDSREGLLVNAIGCHFDDEESDTVVVELFDDYSSALKASRDFLASTGERTAKCLIIPAKGVKQITRGSLEIVNVPTYKGKEEITPL